MSNNINNKVCIIGAGDMAFEYSRVLDSLDLSYIVIGRGKNSAQLFQDKTGHEVYTGGIDNTFNSKIIDVPNKAIVAVGIKELSKTAIKLMDYGVKNILLEKPGGLNLEDIEEVYKKSKNCKANVYIAYNRRYYTSVDKARDIIKKDGGVISFSFDFTEWSHEVEKLDIEPIIKRNWFLANSSHVVDLAFFLCGRPKEIKSYISGTLDWHPGASVFIGSGLTENDILFTYNSNWESPGRWGIKIKTKFHQIILQPLEKIQIQEKGSINIKYIDIQDKIDLDYKAGLFNQTKNFINYKINNLCSINEQLSMMKYYYQIMGINN